MMEVIKCFKTDKFGSLIFN